MQLIKAFLEFSYPVLHIRDMFFKLKFVANIIFSFIKLKLEKR